MRVEYSLEIGTWGVGILFVPICVHLWLKNPRNPWFQTGFKPIQAKMTGALP
jgi:hypothetical protein